MLSILSALFMELTAGLLYPSESDRPFTVRPFAAPSVNEAKLRTEFQISADKHLVEKELTDFFGKWADPQPWHDAGYRKVQQQMSALRSALTSRPGVRVLKFQSVESDWIILIPENRGYTVLHTQSVET